MNCLNVRSCQLLLLSLSITLDSDLNIISYLSSPLLLLLDGEQLDDVLMFDFLQHLAVDHIDDGLFDSQLLTVSPRILSSGLPVVSCGSVGWRFSQPQFHHYACLLPDNEQWIDSNKYYSMIFFSHLEHGSCGSFPQDTGGAPDIVGGSSEKWHLQLWLFFLNCSTVIIVNITSSLECVSLGWWNAVSTLVFDSVPSVPSVPLSQVAGGALIWYQQLLITLLLATVLVTSHRKWSSPVNESCCQQQAGVSLVVSYDLCPVFTVYQQSAALHCHCCSCWYSWQCWWWDWHWPGDSDLETNIIIDSNEQYWM